MMTTIFHHTDKQRFSTVLNANTAYVDYDLRGDVMEITHTIVPEAIGGRGIAGKLNEAALKTAREQGWKVIPTCSYTAAYIQRHPEYEDLLAK